MTICIAALCEQRSIIVGASDRMITAGDIQFQPWQTKLWGMNASVVVMMAGDTAFQTEICASVQADVQKFSQKHKDTAIPVATVAKLYQEHFNAGRLRRSDADVLAPFGLDHNTFVARQHEMADKFISDISSEIFSYKLPRVGALIVGVDDTGGHIYVADGGSVTCQDLVGFAAVGTGYWHANSYFRFAGHTGYNKFADAFFRVYAAKKRAEVAPGVGVETDMLTIGSSLGTYLTVTPEHINKLAEVYEDAVAKNRALIVAAEGKINKYVEEIRAAATAARAKESKGVDQPPNRP